VWPHGGPEAQELADYRARHQFWANHGIAVFAPNFRGSTGFGTKFQRLIYKDWGGGHYRDVTSGVRELIRKGWVEPTRVGIYGGSFGGYTTLWAITQDPELWKAAVAVVAPSNLKTLIESTHASWRRWAEELIGDLSDPDGLAKRSPLSYADRVRTPLLLFQGANDPRVPKAEADQFADALKRHSIPCDYVVFENEGHGWRTLERVFEEMERSLGFMQKHLANGHDGAAHAEPELAAVK
jgi:dipeptidyl aminopeptidase/acylaminoacyl peptidase